MDFEPHPIDIKKEFKRRALLERQEEERGNFVFWQNRGKLFNARSAFVNPFFVSDNSFGNIRTISRVQYGGVGCRTLRAIAQKAWIINTCINHISKKIKPFLKESTDKNMRGFNVVKRNGKTSGNDKEAKRIIDLILNTGNYEDSTRDDFIRYCTKLTRDLLTLDQIATEIQYDKKGEVCGFFAVDAATIERVLPEKEWEKNQELNPNDYQFLQIIDGTPSAGYTSDTMLFDFANPRTDIYHSMYGYSYVEQAVDLITSVIHAFSYNMGNFTENKLPKGMLLINGDLSKDVIDDMTDYIAEIMSGGPVNQWRVPVIPSGQKDGGNIEWKEINGKNREMEFQAWLDYLTSGVVAIFGCSMDELGIQSQKSQAMFENGGTDRIAASKSLILGDILTFLESYINKIVKKINPEYKFEFVGYELTDPKAEMDLFKTKLEAGYTTNEIRELMGLKKLESKWADEVTLNPQAVQCYQAENAQTQMGEGAEGDGEEDDSWGEYGDMQMGEDEENAGDVEAESEEVTEENSEAVNKSLVMYI